MSKKQRAFYIILAAMLLNMNSVSMFASADDEVITANRTGVVSQSEEDTSFEKAYEKTSEKTNAVQSVKTMSVNAAASAPEIKQIADHKWSKWTVTKQPTVTQTGLQMRTCSECGKKEIMPVRKLSLRIFGANRFDTSLEIAKQYRKENGNKLFSNIIIVSGMQFPDALSASYLASVKDAPIIVTSDNEGVMNNVAAFVKDNSEKKANVYIVGGSGAVSDIMVKKLAGYNVKRVWGSNRFVTNLETIKEAGGTNDEIIIASGMNYPDALSASAVGKPILLVQGKTLTEQQQDFLKDNPKAKAVIVGGTGAVSSEIEQQVKKIVSKTERLAGGNRYETSKMVADRFFGKNAETVMLSYGLNFPDGLCGGPLAAKYGAPLLMADNKTTNYAANYAASVGSDAQSIISGAVTLGGDTLISNDSVNKVIPQSRVEKLFTIQTQDADFIISQPKDWSGSANGVASFTTLTDIKNASYRWQSSHDGRTWKDIDGAEKATYSVNADVGLNGTMYRCVVTAGCGETIVSDSARIFVASELSVSTQLQDWGGELGSVAYLFTQANKSGVKYNWQYSGDNGETWQDAGVSEQECRVKLTRENDGRLYRCVITDSDTGESVITRSAKLIVVSDFEIVAQPQAVSGDLGSTQRITVQSGGEGLKFQWQISPDGKTNIKDITDAESAKSPCLIQTVKPENCGMYYRCIITDKNGKQITSDFARLFSNETGFVKFGEKTYYIGDDHSIAKGIAKIGNNTYCFSDTGEMLTGIQTIGGELYYFDPDNGKMRSGVVNIEGKTYCFDENGKAVTGWFTDADKKTYCFSDKDKTAVTGLKVIDGKKYFFDQNGVKTTGVVKNKDGKYEYISDEPVKSEFIDIGGVTYYIDENGYALTGLQTIGSDTYYFGKNATMLTGGYLIDGKRYFFDVDTGKAKVGPYKRENDKTYYYNGKNGVGTGLIKVGSELHLYDDEGIEQYGRKLVNGKYYYFDKQTGAAISGWRDLITSSGNSYTSYYSPEDNAAVTGLQKIGNDYYLFDDNGYRLHGIRTVDGVYCLFDNTTGKLYTGWYDNGSYLYYYDGLNGRIQGNKCVEIEGKNYFFNNSGVLCSGIRTTAEGKAMYFDPTDYSLVTGWVGVDGKAYYCDGTNGLKSGNVTIDGNEYYFSPTSYVCLKGARTVDEVPCWFDENTGIRTTGFQYNSSNDRYYLYNDNGRTTGFNYYGKVLYNLSQYGIPSKGAYGQNSNPYGFRTYFDTETGEQQLGLITYTASNGNTYTYYYLDTNCVTAASEIELIKQKIERAKTVPGWQNVEGLVYYVQNGDFAKGLQQIDDKTYYFSTLTGAQLIGLRRIGSDYYLFSDRDGRMLTGWQTVEGKQMYFDTVSGKMLTGLQTIDEKTYCLLQGGGYATGTVQIGADTYIFDNDGSGEKKNRTPGSRPLDNIKTYCWETIEGKSYYHGKDGSFVKGIQIIDKRMYLFDDTGAMQTGVIEHDGIIRCYTDDGVLIGLQEIDGKLYYFDELGAALTEKIKVIDSKTYFFTEDGSAATGFCYVPQYLCTFYFDKDHTAHTGWLELNRKKYYFYTEKSSFYPAGTPAHGITYVDGKTMYFDYETAEQKTGLVQVGLNRFMYFDPKTGSAVSGLKNIDGSLFLFSDATESFGVSLWGLQTIGNDTYYFDEATQKSVSGFVTSGSNTYYFDKNFKMVKGMQIIGNDRYYFNTDKGNMLSGIYTIGGAVYCFGDNGRAVTGWYTTENGDRYYFSESDNKAYTGVHIIDGKKYYFDANGKSKTGLIKDADGQYHYITNEGQASGFIEINGNTYYVDTEGCVLTGLQTIGKDLYYFSKYGVMQTGAATVDDKRFFFDPKTGKAAVGFVERENGYTYYYDGANGVKTGFVTVNGKLYRLGTSGNKLYGKQLVDGSYYFFDPQTGAAASDWVESFTSTGDVYRSYYSPTDHKAAIGLKQIDGAYYYFSSLGNAVSGSYKVDGVSMYFDPNTQKLYTGPVTINGKIYYSDGLKGLKQDSSQKVPANALSWGTIGGAKCYYGINGKPITGLQIIDKKLYMFDTDGKLLTGFISYRGITRYYTDKGALTGLQTISGGSYYFSPANASMIKGLKDISDVKYSFDDDGRNSEGWIVVNGNFRCYIDHNKGVLTGLQQIDGKWYWLGTNGIMCTGMQTVTDSTGAQKICLFDEDGEMVYGFVQMNDKLYYFDEKTGERASGWKTINGKKYYFSPSNGAALKGRQNINNYNYYFDIDTAENKTGLICYKDHLYCFSDKTKDGLTYGLTKIDGDLYYFNENSGMAKKGFLNLDEVYYYFPEETGKSVEGIKWVNKDTAFYFEKSGGIRKGLVTFEGKQYYLHPSTGKVTTGLVSSGNKLYCFAENGEMMKNTTVVKGGITYSIDDNGIVSIVGNRKIEKLIRSGIEKLGMPYWEETDERDDPIDPTTGYNCSGFVSKLLSDININVTSIAFRQQHILTHSGNYEFEYVTTYDDLKPGDIIYRTSLTCASNGQCSFFDHIHHVMIYIGDGRVIHSTATDLSEMRGVSIGILSDSEIWYTYNIIRLKEISSDNE